MTTFESASVQKDFNNLFLGEKLGQGIHRQVFEHALDRKLVIKVESHARCFANVREWDVWMNIQFAPDLARWFAPVVGISDNGNVLLQRRTKPIKELPAELPNFFTDIKPENFGRLGDRIVCHDYALQLLISRGFNGWKMKKLTDYQRYN